MPGWAGLSEWKGSSEIAYAFFPFYVSYGYTFRGCATLRKTAFYA
jgi:hypothetical protein